MKFEKVNCLVSLGNDGKSECMTQVPMAGPSAISVTEIPLIQMQHGPDAVTRVHSAGFYESDKSTERERILYSYPAKLVEKMYPGIHAPMPKTIDDLELPNKHLHDAPAPEPVKTKDEQIAELKAQLAEKSFVKDTQADAEKTKAEWRAELKEAGVTVPLGNFSIEKLASMMPAEGA